jgi:DNA-binding MarR family transcriptional regulator
MPIPADDCARSVLDAVPLVMREIRAEMRSHRGLDLSVPQFRALAFLRRRPAASLSDLAAHIGTSLPSMSKLVNGLVGRGLVERDTSAADRRRLTLRLTREGTSLLQAARAETQTHLSRSLGRLSPEEQAVVTRALGILSSLFGQEGRT